MARPLSSRYPNDHPAIDAMQNSGIADGRCYVRSSGGAYGYPLAGGDVDGAMMHMVNSPGFPTNEISFHAIPGALITLESAAAFSAGDLLATTSDGRVQAKATGQIAIARALDVATGAGQIVKCVWSSGRSA